MLARLGIICAVTLALGGCASAKPTTKSAYQAYVDTYTQAQANPPKLFSFECAPPGCNFTKFEAYQVGGLQNSLQPPAAEVPVGLQVFREIKDTVLGIGPWYFGARVLTKAFDVANHATTTNTTTNTTSSTDNSNHAVTSTTNNTTTTTTSTTNSNNTTHTCSTGQSQGGGTTTGSGGTGGGTGGTNC